ncbi:ABC transporter ATP-binding protein [Flammeovirgaceae bacterium 311]|nr:ABC transporter ATP-binding protein [Flammeovirgaceae bacterium 311]
MSDIAIKVEDLSKQYRLGVVGTGTLSHDINRWWHKVRGNEDPYLKIGETNDRSTKGQSEYVWALKDINFNVAKGEVLGIIGKNGAGKSTLLKLLSRVTTPTTGVIKTKGRIASLLEVGTGFHPELTGRDNIYLNGAILGMTKAEIGRKFDEIVEFSGTARYIDTPVKRYSSGMRVRLAFAVAAFLEPEILIVDEVLAVGDAEFQTKAIGKMQDVAKGEGRTVLFVSHNMASIQSLCTRGILMSNGTVYSDGSVHDVIKQYLSINHQNDNSYYACSNTDTGQLVLIERIDIYSNHERINQVISGQDVTVSIKYKSKEKGLKCSAYIGIYDHFGDKILHLGSPYGGLDSFDSGLEGTITCTLPRIPLVAGKYFLNFALHINGQPFISLKNALSMTIEAGDFYGNGRLPKPKDSKLLIDQSWGIE